MKVERLAIFKDDTTGKHAGSDARPMTLEAALQELPPSEQEIARAAVTARSEYHFSRVISSLRISGRIMSLDAPLHNLDNVEAAAR